MPQYRKDDVEQSILTAALQVFASKGYEGATIAEIAKAARVSTGNVYRYFESKERLFDTVVDDAFVERFSSLLRRRVLALAGTNDIASLGPDADYHLAAEELLAFCIEHRLRVVVLLGRSKGSRVEGVRNATVAELIKLAVAHFRGLSHGLRVTASMRFVLDQVYGSYVDGLVSILASFEEERAIREAAVDYGRYHLSGVKSFFER